LFHRSNSTTTAFTSLFDSNNNSCNDNSNNEKIFSKQTTNIGPSNVPNFNNNININTHFDFGVSNSTPIKKTFTNRRIVKSNKSTNDGLNNIEKSSLSSGPWRPNFSTPTGTKESANRKNDGGSAYIKKDSTDIATTHMNTRSTIYANATLTPTSNNKIHHNNSINHSINNNKSDEGAQTISGINVGVKHNLSNKTPPLTKCTEPDSDSDSCEYEDVNDSEESGNSNNNNHSNSNHSSSKDAANNGYYHNNLRQQIHPDIATKTANIYPTTDPLFDHTNTKDTTKSYTEDKTFDNTAKYTASVMYRVCEEPWKNGKEYYKAGDYLK
jgi:hypothetical protein